MNPQTSTPTETLSRYRSRVDRRKSDYRAARKAAKREKALLGDVRARLKAAGEARDIAQAVGEAVQRKAHKHVAGLVTRCLRAVFGESAYEFSIIFERKRNRTEARAVYLRDGNEVDPLTAAGGGTVDVTSFALRLSVLLMRHPRPRRVLFLDEPFRFVSEEYRPRVRALIEALSEELDFQVVMVTHFPDLECGKVVRLDKAQARTPKAPRDT